MISHFVHLLIPSSLSSPPLLLPTPTTPIDPSHHQSLFIFEKHCICSIAATHSFPSVSSLLSLAHLPPIPVSLSPSSWEQMTRQITASLYTSLFPLTFLAAVNTDVSLWAAEMKTKGKKRKKCRSVSFWLFFFKSQWEYLTSTWFGEQSISVFYCTVCLSMHDNSVQHTKAYAVSFFKLQYHCVWHIGPLIMPGTAWGLIPMLKGTCYDRCWGKESHFPPWETDP